MRHPLISKGISTFNN